MVWFRKWMILIHRWLGIVLSLLFVLWFVSGIAMIYAGGMPSLSREERLDKLPGLDLARVRVTPSDAAQKAELSRPPAGVTLLNVMDRPAYRFGGREPATVFADTGEVLQDVGEAEALAIASRFMNLSKENLHYVGLLTEPDQWTITELRQLPMHKITVDDDAHTELYVSELSAEVGLQTTRGTRALAWVAAIPHWLHYWAILTVVAALPLLLLGAQVTTMGAGMVDQQSLREPWHLFTVSFSIENFAYLIEHSHRFFGWLVGACTIVLAVALWRSARHSAIRWTSRFAIHQVREAAFRACRADPRSCPSVPAPGAVALRPVP